MELTVRCADMRDVFDWPDGVVLTDPPFGLGKSYAGTVEDIPFTDHVANVLSIPAKRHVIRAPQQALWDRMLPEPDAVYIECRTFGMNTPIGRVRRWQPWLVYGSVVRPRLPDWWSQGPAHGNTDGIRHRPTASGDHPGLTPAQATNAMLARCAEPGSLIIDPFAGLGSIGVAAILAGHGYFGVEIVAEWSVEAARRCDLAASGVTVNLEDTVGSWS